MQFSIQISQTGKYIGEWLCEHANCGGTVGMPAVFWDPNGQYGFEWLCEHANCGTWNIVWSPAHKNCTLTVQAVDDKLIAETVEALHRSNCNDRACKYWLDVFNEELDRRGLFRLMEMSREVAAIEA
jgi:hypothetical protein